MMRNPEKLSGLLISVAFLVTVPVTPLAIGQAPEAGTESLVPPERRVTAREARLAKARLLSSKDTSVRAALVMYRDLAKENPTDIEVQRELAGILMRVELFDQALESWHVVLAHLPSDYDALLNLGKCYLWTKQQEKAIPFLERVASSHPREPEAFMFLARTYTSQKLHEKAIARAQAYLMLKGASSFDGLSEIGDAYFGASDFIHSTEVYRRALKNAPASIPNDTKTLVRKRLALSLSWSQDTDEALPLLSALSTEFPKDDQIALELARAYSRRGDFARVVPTLERISAQAKNGLQLAWDVADLFLAIGHFRQAATIYAESVASNPNDQSLALLYADRMSSWGDFDEAAQLYRNHLKEHPDDRSIQLKLARALTSAEQTEAAESVYRELLISNSEDAEVLRDLASLKLLEGKESAAREILSTHGNLSVITPESLLASGVVALKAGNYSLADSLFKKLEAFPRFEQVAKANRADALIELGRIDDARTLLSSVAKKSPRNKESHYFLHSTSGKLSPTFAETVLSDPTTMPMDMLEWGKLAIKNKDTISALRFFEASVKADPDFIPGQIALAELASVEGDYARAFEIYSKLMATFPHSTKIRTERARSLAFSRQYDEAIHAFEAIHAEYPENLISIREAARVAFWGKDFEHGTTLYRRILEPNVDRLLISDLEKIEDSDHLALLLEAAQNLQDNSVYQGYERAYSTLEKNQSTFSSGDRSALQQLFARRYGLYRIQKALSLELESKIALWNRRPNDARQSLDMLIAFEPGNKEAIFDAAQVSCAQGDLKTSRTCYDRLLALAPLHKIAPGARERLLDRERPSFLASTYGRAENGRGELARFSRSISTFGFEAPLSDSTSFAVLTNYWREVPYDKRESYDSFGPTLDATTRFNDKLKANVHGSYRTYEDGDFHDRQTGSATAWYRLHDWVEISGGYERADEIYNRIGLEKGIQSDGLWLAAEGRLARNTEFLVSAKQLWYTDTNSRQIFTFGMAQALSEQPRTFKIGFRGEYHDTSEANIFVAGPDGAVEIEHPYWTPQQYASGFLTTEWFHELSEILFCHQRRHFYRIRAEPFLATDGNVGGEFSAEWMIELENQLGLGARASIQRSQLYDAEQGLLFLRYSF